MRGISDGLIYFSALLVVQRKHTLTQCVALRDDTIIFTLIKSSVALNGQPQAELNALVDAIVLTVCSCVAIFGLYSACRT